MEIFRALAVLIERPCAELRPVADALGLPALPEETEYSDTLLFQFYPYASIYLDEQGMLGGEARDRIAGFWRAFKLEPPPEPDHLPVMLSLYSQLAEQQPSEGSRDEFWMRARTTFFREHLASWLPFYADRLVTSTSSEFYKQWAGVLLAALGQEGTQLDGRDLVSSHFDSSYALDDPRVSGLEPFLDSLLAPARSGVILTRSHLNRLAKERDLGGRIAERKYMLRAMIQQDASAVFDWLTSESADLAARHLSFEPEFGNAALDWQQRALATSKLLKELAAESTNIAAT